MSHSMLQSMRSQRVRHDLATQQQHYTQRQNTGQRICEIWRNNQEPKIKLPGTYLRRIEKQNLKERKLSEK